MLLKSPAPLLAYAALALAYVASGALGLLLAVPPGYATAVFPPAGIAMAAMLLAGAPTLPWTFLGSLLLNLWAAYSIDRHIDPVGVAVAVVIALASMAQAALGGAVLRRAIGVPTPLDNARDIRRFLLLSPLCCLASATLSLSAMWALGAVDSRDLVTSWMAWWIGDTLGVLFVLPLMLVLAGEPRTLWRGRARLVALPMVLFFALFVAIFVRVSHWESDQSLLEFRMRSQHLADMVQASLEEQSVFLEQLGGAFAAARQPLGRRDFRQRVHSLLQRFPTIQAVEWAPRVDASDRAQFEAMQRTELADFTIRERDPGGTLRAAGTRAQFYPVTFVEPIGGNEEAMGFDLASNAIRRTAIDAAITQGNDAATAPVRLVQETGEQAGILLMHPVSGGPNGPGIVLVVLRMDTFTRTLLGPLAPELNLRFLDASATRPLFDDFPIDTDTATYESAFTFGTRRYVLLTAPTARYLGEHRGWQSWAVLVAGVFSTGLLGALLMLGTAQAHRAQRLVEERTLELQAANQRLQSEMEERQRAQAALQQAQRMEAMGQVTGGVAHDFNNLLQVVGGHAELLRLEALGDRLLTRVLAIIRAAERGKHLTRQLLAYARRQALRPEPVNFKESATEIADMLARMLREDIAVTVDVPNDLWTILVDRAELELALLNVGVNARDAMPKGGALRIEARNVSYATGAGTNHGLSGNFVVLKISDTGVGMPPEILAKATEPFFTTKGPGQGSGLGLSQVHGFATQSGGAALIASEPGQGTTVSIFLPVAPPSRVVTAKPAAPSQVALPPLRVLLAEDDDGVAEISAEVLRDLGCSVLRAANGKSAVAAFVENPGIDLLLSDVVMVGGMSGLELARALRERRPDLPVLLMTGYSPSMAQVMEEGFALLEKPYNRASLVAAIRAAIERQPARVKAVP